MFIFSEKDMPRAPKREALNYSLLNNVQPGQSVLVEHIDRARVYAAAKARWNCVYSYSYNEEVVIKRLA